MKQEYDFSRGRRGAVVPQKGKTRITMYVDNDVLDAFRSFSEEAGTGYQTMINEALKDYLGKRKPPIDEETLRRVLREELHAANPFSKQRSYVKYPNLAVLHGIIL